MREDLQTAVAHSVCGFCLVVAGNRQLHGTGHTGVGAAGRHGGQRACWPTNWPFAMCGRTLARRRCWCLMRDHRRLCRLHALQPPPPTGPLRPAGEPSPKLSCPRQARSRRSGDRCSAPMPVIGQGNGPFTPFKVADCPVLSLHAHGRGLTFSDVGYDYDDDIAFMIRDGIYQPLSAPGTAGDPARSQHLSSCSTITIRKSIYVRYLNRNAVRIRGRFMCGKAPRR